MLHWSAGSTFAAGRSRYLDFDENQGEPAEARIHVRVEFDGAVVLALLDTGAVWSVVDAELADELGFFARDGEPKTLTSRAGKFEGRLVRAVTRLVAEEGESVEIEATVFVSPEWRAGNFIGYSGLLERIRFAVDPDTNSFLFGAL